MIYRRSLVMAAPPPSPSGSLVSPQDSMATEEPSTSKEQEQEQEQEGWRWDCSCNLLYHASTGFYHDPGAGWYYNTQDGLYYDEAFNLLPPPATPQSPAQEQQQQEQDPDPQELEEASASASDNTPCPPPSQWLDELLINQYLSGYRNAPVHVGEGEYQKDNEPSEEMLAASTLDGQENNTTPQNGSGTEGMLSAEEEKWMAQYGQVDRSETDEEGSIMKAIDLWDWELVKELASHKIARLMGQLVGQSTSMHPSLPSSGGTLKTTAIRQVHLDLVLVASGKVYRLRTPSKRYLATLSEYDSSNPTKDWGFPLLSPHSLSLLSPPTTDFNPSSSSSIDLDAASSSQKQGTNESRYRDRAAERRRLHGANSIAPCQKDGNGDTGWACDDDDDPTIAQEEARMLSFGSNSYGSKIMQGMGWKQGEALGGSMKGILEPVEAKGNTGTSGLGWQQHKSTTFHAVRR